MPYLDMVKYKKTQKKSKTETKVTHSDLNKLISEIDKTNLNIVVALQLIAKDVDMVKKEIYEIHKKLYAGPIPDPKEEFKKNN